MWPRAADKLFCLMVDELIGKQEVVIKSLGEGMRNIAGVAGGAILGDGRVGLILDPEGLFGSTGRAMANEVVFSSAIGSGGRRAEADGQRVPPDRRSGLPAFRPGSEARQGGAGGGAAGQEAAQAADLHTFAEYHRHVLADSTGDALMELIDALTTNHTSFLRERAHFEFLARAANEEFRAVSHAAHLERGLFERRGALFDRDVSGGGSGQDRPRRGSSASWPPTSRPGCWTRRGAAFTRPAVSTKCRNPGAALICCAGRANRKGFYKVKPALAQRIEFERLNLIEPFPRRGLFHVIFCRNVMMYFDKATQQDIVQRLSACLERGGYLFVGHSESLTGVEHALGLCPAGHLSQSKGGGRIEALAMRKSWR